MIKKRSQLDPIFSLVEEIGVIKHNACLFLKHLHRHSYMMTFLQKSGKISRLFDILNYQGLVR